MIKIVLLILLTVTFSLGGFFKNDSNATQKEDAENERLCKLFTQKTEKYKAIMRQDELAVKTLQSYEKRASLYCDKVK